jgi:hypothetical protein
VDIERALFGVKADVTVAGGMLMTTSYFTKGAKGFWLGSTSIVRTRTGGCT